MSIAGASYLFVHFFLDGRQGKEGIEEEEEKKRRRGKGRGEGRKGKKRGKGRGRRIGMV